MIVATYYKVRFCHCWSLSGGKRKNQNIDKKTKWRRCHIRLPLTTVANRKCGPENTVGAWSCFDLFSFRINDWLNCTCSMFCCTLNYFMPILVSIAIFLMGKRELVALLNLSSWSLVMVERLFLAVYLPDTPNTSRRVLRGVRAKMALIFSQNNQNITCKDVLITWQYIKNGISTSFVLQCVII